METVSIVRATAVPPAGFGAVAALRLVLGEDAGTKRAYTRSAAAGETLADLQGEARALETQGDIARSTLDADWAPVVFDGERDEVEVETSAIMQDGYSPEEDELEDEREPLQ